MRSAVVFGLVALLGLAACAQAQKQVVGNVNMGALFSALKYKMSKTSAYLIYQEYANLALANPSATGGPNTVLMPTDNAWYRFFLDYQRGSEYIRQKVGHVAATYPDLTDYTPADFATLMQGMITYQPNFAKLCVKLLNHMTLPGNVTVQTLQKKKKDQMVPNASSYPLYIVKTHPPTLKAVPSDFDDALFSQRRSIDPMYIPRMVARTTAIIEQRVYKGSRLIVHLVDNVVPYINTTFTDPPAPPPPGGKFAFRTSSSSILVILAAALAAVMIRL